MATYFGHTTEYATTGTQASYSKRNKGSVFTCPGTGNQLVKEMSAFVKGTGAFGGHIRLAIYNTAVDTLICEGTAEVTVDNSAAAWVGHMTQASITPNPATLVGGTDYVLIFSLDSAEVTYYYTGVANAGDANNIAADYTDSGFPASLGAGSDQTRLYSARIGVDPAPTGNPVWFREAATLLNGGLNQ